MPIAVLPAQPADVDIIVELYFVSFQNVFALYVLPDIPSVRQWFISELAKELQDPSALFLLAFEDPKNTVIEDANRDRSTAIGFAKWVRPSYDDKVPSTDLPTWPEGADGPVADDFFGKIGRAHAAAMGTRPHWYLEMLGTLPAAQGRGAGSALVRRGCEAADAAEEEAYLESSPDGLHLYERFGFVKVDTVEIEWEPKAKGGEKCQYANPIMVRKPKTQS
jgi:ribosomal protein S18 acetylase RimI-like enzyme